MYIIIVISLSMVIKTKRLAPGPWYLQYINISCDSAACPRHQGRKPISYETIVFSLIKLVTINVKETLLPNVEGTLLFHLASLTLEITQPNNMLFCCHFVDNLSVYVLGSR